MLLAYCRISTDDKGQNIDNQVHTIKRAGYEVKMLFCDEGVSGSTSPLKREGFNRLYTVAKAGDVIVLTAYDRLSRNTQHFLAMLDALRLRGVSLVSLRENIDTSTPVGLAMATTVMTFAQLERDNIAERTRQALQRLKDEGRILGRPKTQAHGDVLQALREGLSVNSVIAMTGASRATVYRIKKELAI